MVRTCGIVRGCVFVSVGDGPVIMFFYTSHTNFNIKIPTLISLRLTALIDVVFYSCTCGRIFPLLNKRNSSPTLQRSRHMPCCPKPSPDSAKVWSLALPNDLSLHILRFIHGYIVFFNRGFLSSSRPLLAHPQPSSPYYTQPPYFRFVSSF